MLLKVKHEELNNVTSVMVKDGETYDAEINKMLEQIEKLRTIWQGQDAEQFCNNVTNYITKMKNIPICLRNMSKFVNSANSGYTEQDESFSQELEVEANNYDEEPSSSNN